MNARSVVMKNVPTYNIVGDILGYRPERMILLSAHYDSYFQRFPG